MHSRLSVNIGHGDPRVITAITEQAQRVALLLHEPAAVCISEVELREGMAIIDRALSVTDGAVQK